MVRDAKTNGAIRIGDWLLTPASHRLTRGDTTHVLRAKLVQILTCLAAEPGLVLQRDELLDRIWPGIIVTDDSLTRGISDLRKLMGDSVDAPRYLETIRKGAG
jgi:DNA-binding winged helix-turn-helix (wHTH) protein